MWDVQVPNEKVLNAKRRAVKAAASPVSGKPRTRAAVNLTAKAN